MTQTQKPWENEDGSTNVDGFLAAYAEDKPFWRAEQGHILNVLEELIDRVDHLSAWKAEAMQVLGDWEAVWETAGRPGPLGFSKAAAVQALIADLRATSSARFP